MQTNHTSRTIFASILVTATLLISSGIMAQDDPNKLEGFKITGLPLISFSTDDGFGYGLRIFGTNYVEGVDPFDYQTYVQYYKTTLGFEFHEVSLDKLNFLGTPYRVRMNAGFSRTLNAQWYGRGNFHDLQKEDKIRNGNLPTGENIPVTADVPIRANQEIPEGWEWVKSFDNPYLTLNRKAVDNFQDFLERNPQRHENSEIVNTKGREYYRQTQNKFYNYDRIRPFATMSTEEWIGDTNFKYFVGFRGQRYKIQSYKNDIDSGDRLPNNQTLIDLERPTGYDATRKERFVNGVRGALAYDSRPRERERNPNSGIFADLHVEGVGKSTGSHYSFTRVTGTYRQYVEVLPSVFNPRGNELVFAYRIQGQETFGDVPFFEAGRIYTMDESGTGIGSNRGVRGYAANQFVDTVMGMVNTELRYTFAKTGFAGGMDFVLLAYYDTGRVADKWENMTADGMHNAVGGGIRMVWQRNTIVNISYGRSKYGVNGNFSFNHMF